MLHQTDFLEHEAVHDVIILSTVLQEARHKNSSVYTRLRELMRNTNKRFYYFSNEHHQVSLPRISGNSNVSFLNTIASTCTLATPTTWESIAMWVKSHHDNASVRVWKIMFRPVKHYHFAPASFAGRTTPLVGDYNHDLALSPQFMYRMTSAHSNVYKPL